MIRLDIGSGQKHGDDGWIGVDAYAPADVTAFMDNLPYENDSVDEIYSSHTLEHIGKFEVPITLREWHRVIKPGGKVTIRVPDLVWCCEHWLQNKNNGWQLDTIFGGQTDAGQFHKTGFWKEYLFQLVRDAGFVVMKYEELDTHSQKTLSIEVTK